MVNELSVEHVLLFVVVAFLLYYLMGSCGYSRDGFNVGGQWCEVTGLFKVLTPQKMVRDGSCHPKCEFCNCCMSSDGGGDDCDFGCIDPH